MNTQLQNITSKIEKIVELFTGSMHKLAKAGEIVVEIIDENEDGIEIIMEHCPSFTRGDLRMLEKLGRGTVMPEIAARSGAIYRKLQNLTLSEQREYVKNGFTLMVKENGHFDTRRIPVDSVTTDNIKQLFDGNQIRDEAMQRSWLESEREKAVRHAAVNDLVQAQRGPYVSKGKLIVPSAVQLTRKELLRYMEDMEK